MIFITDQMYAELANMLFAELVDGRHFFNGKLEYDREQFYSTLTCSLIVYQSEIRAEKREVPEVKKVMPVWWDFSTCAEGLDTPNDFSWTEFSTFFPCYE